MGMLPTSTKLKMGLPPCYYLCGGKTAVMMQPLGHKFAFKVVQGSLCWSLVLAMSQQENVLLWWLHKIRKLPTRTKSKFCLVSNENYAKSILIVGNCWCLWWINIANWMSSMLIHYLIGENIIKVSYPEKNIHCKITLMWWSIQNGRFISKALLSLALQLALDYVGVSLVCSLLKGATFQI